MNEQKPDLASRPDPDDPRLAYQIHYLEPTARGLRACRQLGVETIRDFLQRDRRDFTELRNCGQQTYEDLAARVHHYLRQEPQLNPPADQLDRPLLGLICNRRAERVFLAKGITTVGDFLETPKEELLAVEGFGERTYWAVSQRIREVTSHRRETPGLLPEALQRFSLGGLGLEVQLHSALMNLGIANAGDLLRFPENILRSEPGVGDAGLAELRGALNRLVRVGIDHTLNVADRGTEIDFDGLVPRILSLLASKARLRGVNSAAMASNPDQKRAASTPVPGSASLSMNFFSPTSMASRPGFTVSLTARPPQKS
jgi:hypothetical protein